MTKGNEKINDLVTKEKKYITFTLEKERYGVEIKYVDRVLGFVEISKVPDLPDYFEGVVKYDGKDIPVIDLRRKYINRGVDISEGSFVIVTEVKNRMLGLLVNSVSEVLYLNEKDIKPATNCESLFGNDSLKGITMKNNVTNVLVDIEKILTKRDIDFIDKFNLS